MTIFNRFFNLTLCGAALLFMAHNLQAQSIYRIVAPDGRVTFSDIPPADFAKAASAKNMDRGATGTSDAGAPLPYELRQVVSRYPVTLYSGAACAPCNSGRLLLQARGVPFTERSVSTPDDVEALQRLSGDKSLPVLTIGGQRIKGFSESEWTQFLNAANYPATSQLPAGYRQAPASPLVVAQKVTPTPASVQPAAAPDEEAASARAVEPPATVAPANPAGIKF